MSGWWPSTASPAHYQRVKLYRGRGPAADRRRRWAIAEDPLDRAAPPVRGVPGRPGPGGLGRRGRDPGPRRHRQGLLVPHGAVLLAGSVLLLHHQPGSGTFFDCHRRAFAHFGGVPATIVYDRTKTVVRRHVAPGRGGAAAPGGGGVRRALRLRHRRAGRLPAHRARAGSSARSRSCRITCWPGAASTAWPRWTPRSRRGCRSAAARSTAPTAQVIGERADGRPGRADRRCPRCRIWWPSGICAGSARTAWSRSRPASTRCRPAGCGPGSGWSCVFTPTPPPDRSSSPPRPSTAAAGWPPIPARPAAAPGSSTRPLGRAARRPHPHHHRRPAAPPGRAVAGPPQPGIGAAAALLTRATPT